MTAPKLPAACTRSCTTASGFTSAPRKAWPRPAPASTRTASSGEKESSPRRHGGHGDFLRKRIAFPAKAGTHRSAARTVVEMDPGLRRECGILLPPCPPCLRGESIRVVQERHRPRSSRRLTEDGAAAHLYDR